MWTLSPQGTLSDSTGQDGARESHRAIQAALGGKQPEEPVLGEYGRRGPVGRGLWEGRGLRSEACSVRGRGLREGRGLGMAELVGGAAEVNRQ